MELQADLLLPPRSQHLVFSVEHQNKENSPPFLAGRSPTPFSALLFIKRQPLQEITHLFATNANAQSVYNDRRMSSVAERRRLVEQTSGVGNKKRKSPNLSHDNNISSSNMKKTIA
ncbi:hypothetical protein SUGI_1061660 [Cryptomeria japonica]|nr:hypothetical protein SUGI_1061660 [Cryptomeria japonica]